MGYNLVWHCRVHRQWATSMRGEEGRDFQWIARVHRACFERGMVEVMIDADASYHDKEAEMWIHSCRPITLTHDRWDALMKLEVAP